ncbi:hypothetical protein JXO59_04025 [candidate division KSB1 bacterium]|nr:hypothetical protein [candidate division KSB1 bacterium]
MKEPDTRLRIRVNSKALVKLASLFTNTVILSANAFLLGHNISRQIRERKTQAVADRLQLTAEVASAVPGLARVIVEAMDEK